MAEKRSAWLHGYLLQWDLAEPPLGRPDAWCLLEGPLEIEGLRDTLVARAVERHQREFDILAVSFSRGEGARAGNAIVVRENVASAFHQRFLESMGSNPPHKIRGRNLAFLLINEHSFL